jgi:PTH1 family peptidyl-tRNA hydrolase
MAESVPWLVVGLGNPGPRYAANRHNVGFMAAESLADLFSPPPSWSERFKGWSAAVREGPLRAVLLRPLTFMNRSGASVSAAAGFFHTPPAQIVVLHDEIDFPFGRLAVKAGGGHGGHNGLRDIIQALGSRDFVRVRVGVGRPLHGEVADYVLSDFSPEERAELPDLVDRARRAALCVMTDGVVTAMNRFNS